MKEIITFTQDELVQMLEGGEVYLDYDETMTIRHGSNEPKQTTIHCTTTFKMEEDN